MKIALAQIDISSGDIPANTDKMVAFVKKAKQAGNDLVIFPEMCDTGYDMNVILEKASSWNVGPVKMLKEASKTYSINIVAGLSKRTPEGVFNGVIVINKDGEQIYDYYKTHLITAKPMLEHNYLKAGDDLGIFELDGIKMGIMTCYEIRFPEIARSLTLKGAELIIIVAAWPLVRLPHWQTLSLSRAIENQVYVACVDRVGNDTGLQFAGSSMIIGPYGNIITSGTQIHEALLEGKINLESIKEVRNQIKVHQDRRPELYYKS